MGFFDRFKKQQKLPADVCREHWSKFLENEIEYPEYIWPNYKTTEFINAFSSLDPLDLCAPYFLLDGIVSEMTLVCRHKVPGNYDNSPQGSMDKYLLVKHYLSAKSQYGYAEEDITLAKRVCALHMNHQNDPISARLRVFFSMDLTELLPADLLALVGEQYLSEKKYNDAQKLFSELIKSGQTGNGKYYLNVGKAQYLSGPQNKSKLTAAVNSFEQAISAGVSEAEPLLQEAQQKLKEIQDRESQLDALKASWRLSDIEDDIKKADKTGNPQLYFKHCVRGVSPDASQKEKELICEAARKYNALIDKLAKENYFNEDNISMLYSQRRMNIRMAESGIIEFMGRGADAYRDGYDDVKQNLVRAREWYRIAAENGDQHAQLYYGIFCKEGYGGDVDYSKAVTYLNEAGKGHQNQEAGRAFYNLAMLVGNGLGIEKNAETASLLLEAAQKLGWGLETEIAFQQDCVNAAKQQILAKELHKETYMYSGNNENYGYVLPPLI